MFPDLQWNEGILRVINSRGLTPGDVQDARNGKKYIKMASAFLMP